MAKSRVNTRNKSKSNTKKAVDLADKAESNGLPLFLNMSPVGKSGTLISSGVIDDDHITELLGTSGQIIYEKMLRSDTQVNKIFAAIVNPIVSAKWDVKAASDTPADVDAAALMKHILFKDYEGGWKAKLEEILEFPFKGFSTFEIIHANKTHKKFGPYTGLANLGFRDQRTLTEWEFDKNTEQLLRVHQEQGGDIEVDAWIPGEALITFFNKRKGNDLGKALCRVLYGPYKRKLLVKQLQVIGVERAAIPVPHLELPNGVAMDSVEVANAKSQLKEFTTAESAYFITPYGWKLNYHAANTFDPSKTQIVIKSENEEMAGAIVAMFLEMGIGGNSGNQAGVEGSIDFFNKALACYADKVCEVINQKLIPQLCAMNFGDTLEVLPELAHSGITADAGKELMEIVTGYVKGGVMTVDPQLEDHVRMAHNLPKKAAGEVVDKNNAKDGEGDKPPEGGDTPAPTDEPQDNIELSDKDPKNAFKLMEVQSEKVTKAIKDALNFTAAKYITDVMNRYNSLSESKKQTATTLIKPGGQAKMRAALKGVLSETALKALEQVRQEVPSKKNIKLSNPEKFMLRLVDKYGPLDEFEFNDFGKLPGHVQVLVAKQAELLTKSSIEELTNRVAFQFSSISLKVNDPEVIRQAMEDTAEDYIDKGSVPIKGINATSSIVNESRDAFFFEPDVLEEIHSFTFTNPDPKTVICKELTGTTFATNDAESLRFTPPLHHNCKSYLRANLKESRGVDKLVISTLSPSAKAKEGITL